MKREVMPGLWLERDKNNVYWLRFRSGDTYGNIRVNDLQSTRHAVCGWINETLGLCPKCGTALVWKVCPLCNPMVTVPREHLFVSRYGVGDIVKSGGKTGQVRSVVFSDGKIIYALDDDSFWDDGVVE